jgi:hypothetical protein
MAILMKVFKHTYYADADGDTYGDAGSYNNGMFNPEGYVSDATDCNDADGAVNPGATEVCNGIDDNCDGNNDEGLTFTTYYADADGDTYGDAGSTVTTMRWRSRRIRIRCNRL